MSPPPCLYDTVIQSYVQLKSGFKSMGQLWDALAPQMVQVLPHCVVCSYRAHQPLQMWTNFTFLRNPLSELWFCEFWLLRWSTMVAEGVASVCWGDQDWLLADPSQTSPPHVSMTLLSWDIPLISFNGSLWDVLLRCSKWLLGAWLDSFTMIWDADWSSESNAPAPCLYDTVIQSYVELKSGSLKDGPFHGPSYTIESQWGKFLYPSCPPGGATFTPFWGYGLQSLQPLQMWQISHFCEIHSLSYEASKVFRNVKSMGQLWDAPAPQGCNFYPILRYGLQSLPASSNVANFTFLWNPLSELRGVKVFLNVKSMRFFLPYFAPGANIVPPIAYKSHSTRFPIRPHVLTPHSWLCDKNCGRSSAPK